MIKLEKIYRINGRENKSGQRKDMRQGDKLKNEDSYMR